MRFLEPDTVVDRLYILRTVRFPHVVNDEHWQYSLAECERFGVDPSDASIVLTWDESLEQVVPIVQLSLRAWRAVGARAGKTGETMPQFFGRDRWWRAPQWHDVWVPAFPPLAAHASVLLQDGRAAAAVVTFREAAEWTRDDVGNVVPAKRWRDDPAAALGEAALIAAHRVAFDGSIATKGGGQ